MGVAWKESTPEGLRLPQYSEGGGAPGNIFVLDCNFHLQSPVGQLIPLPAPSTRALACVVASEIALVEADARWPIGTCPASRIQICVAEYRTEFATFVFWFTSADGFSGGFGERKENSGRKADCFRLTSRLTRAPDRRTKRPVCD